MDFKTHQSRLSQLSARFNLMVCLVFGLLVSNVLLSCFVYSAFKHHTVEITPFSGNPGYLKSASFVDSHYLSLMTENFINERLNVSPETVDANHKRLLSFVSHQQYPYFLKLFAQEARVIKNKKMSSTFDITEIKVNPNELNAVVNGKLKRYVGIQALSDTQTTYKLVFQYMDGRLSIVQFAPKKESNDA
ncbi:MULTISPECIES: type IV conjugative transfer system protein TraE [Legionellaceae]|uniref:Type IV conjugative transfer system protein TraE n=1 Tax=Legionella bozemanae TaxID=447 RepID=A0A0W0R9I0_LEGBO|nr:MULTISPECIES: type IV conjugative transfer system protein TraE [Legionellaceae]KTC67699.1 Type IV conjugative transfer system protein TraE [Legionella bozemanae]MCW8497082.1 type IV conjugative transfer system protein TraE [Fluoribacter dumoffii]STO32888.1 conjugal transfer pilus assembly protein TraE [Legionella bozemanae]